MKKLLVLAVSMIISCSLFAQQAPEDKDLALAKKVAMEKVTKLPVDMIQWTGEISRLVKYKQADEKGYNAWLTSLPKDKEYAKIIGNAVSDVENMTKKMKEDDKDIKKKDQSDKSSGKKSLKNTKKLSIDDLDDEDDEGVATKSGNDVTKKDNNDYARDNDFKKDRI